MDNLVFRYLLAVLVAMDAIAYKRPKLFLLISIFCYFNQNYPYTRALSAFVKLKRSTAGFPGNIQNMADAEMGESKNGKTEFRLAINNFQLIKK